MQCPAEVTSRDHFRAIPDICRVSKSTRQMFRGNFVSPRVDSILGLAHSYFFFVNHFATLARQRFTVEVIFCTSSFGRLTPSSWTVSLVISSWRVLASCPRLSPTRSSWFLRSSMASCRAARAVRPSFRFQPVSDCRPLV